MSGTVEQALAAARALGVDRLDAQLLLARRLGRARSWLLAHGDAPLTPQLRSDFDADCRRRAQGEPFAYIVGEREFHGLMLHVDPNVLVPRPDTETLVDWALQLLDGELARRPVVHVADLGTGSGAIALAVKAARPACQVVATDLSAAALAVARTNAARHGIELGFALGDWWSALPQGRFDMVLANPPYIDADDAHLAALRHEPALALTPGADGLGSIRRIVEHAPPRLQAGGWLLLEHGHEQAETVCALLRAAGFEAIATRRDLAGRPRCSGARRPH